MGVVPLDGVVLERRCKRSGAGLQMLRATLVHHQSGVVLSSNILDYFSHHGDVFFLWYPLSFCAIYPMPALTRFNASTCRYTRRRRTAMCIRCTTWLRLPFSLPYNIRHCDSKIKVYHIPLHPLSHPRLSVNVDFSPIERRSNLQYVMCRPFSAT
ncbi:hypothetical protein DL93DRAFT_786205 [Clavulina sp. PMI_390]|nr:hypothetical protein DL93DRAFT_786205 [Clavulina sp. PMI_390]